MQIIVIHGGSVYDSYEEYFRDLVNTEFDISRLSKKGWKSSLGDKLGHGYEVVRPNMPNSSNAKYAEWKVWFDKIVPYIEDGAVLIGHSLGGIFLAKYLANEIMPKKIKALFLISAPFDDSESEDTLADFNLFENLEKINQQVGKIYIYHSKDDPVVPISHLYKYQKLLPTAIVKVFEDRQHFNQETFPEIVEDIKKLK